VGLWVRNVFVCIVWVGGGCDLCDQVVTMFFTHTSVSARHLISHTHVHVTRTYTHTLTHAR
jgi:hypothetical protein